MKFKILLGILIFSYIGFAQQPDTVGVASQVDSILRRAITLSHEGASDKAMELCEVASQLVLEKLGYETSAYGNVCSTYGHVFNHQSNFSKAEEWLLRALEIKGKSLGKAHLSCVKDLSLLGYLYQRFGKYPDSERLLVEAKSICQTNLGKSHPRYIRAIINLATLYSQMGDSEKAEILFLEAMDLFESGYLDKSNPSYGVLLNNLANFYAEMGLYQKAELLYLKSKGLVREKLGEEHLEYARSLSNLASNFLQMEQYDSAEPLLLRAKTIMEKAGATEDAVYSEILSNLGYLYIQVNQIEQAEPLLEESMQIEEKLSGRQHFRMAAAMNGLAELNKKKGNVTRAETLYLEALAINIATVGKEHPIYMYLTHDIATFYWSIHRFNEAIPFLEEMCKGEISQIIKSAQHLSERELSEHIKSFSKDQSILFSFAQSQSVLLELSYDNILFYKGFLLNAIQQLQGVAARNPASAEKLEELKSHQRQLSVHYTASIAERDSMNIALLEAKANTLEKEITREVEGYSEAIRQVRWQEVQTALKPGEVAIEFVDYQYFDPNPTDSIMYAALVLRHGDPQPQFIPLFEKNELLPLLRGATGGNNFIKINALYTSKPFSAGQKSPYELIWKPLEQSLKNISTVFCAPSGLLHYLNLAAIPGPGGKPFGEDCQLVLLGSTRSLAVDSKANNRTHLNATNSTASADAYLAGGIRYESDQNARALANQNFAMRSSERSGAPEFQPDSSVTRAGDLNYLSATATEVREIGQMLRAANFSVQVDTGFFASEEAFRSIGIGKPSPRILHLATHGYFFPDPKGKKAREGGHEPVFKMSEHPMIRSGLIMAGAKQAWLTGKHPEGQEDGILTAYEISQMNLSNTELVVLSACETGLGQVSGNEGVYGLQRAFKIAGAKYLIMSLWKVDDRSTKAFMAEFYKQWLQRNQPIPQAFRAAQQVMRAKNSNAYDWAGFVLIE